MDFSKLRTKFFAATVALFAVAGIITIVMATRSLDRLSTIISETGTGLRTAEKAQHAAQIAILKADQAAEQSEIKINNARELNAKQKEIGEREAALRGFYRGALRIIASQLESILSPMAPDDRDFFVLNDEVYLTVMKGAKSVKFFPATDPENLKEVAENEGLSPVRTDQLASAIQENADAEAPYMAFDSADDAIRIIANIGPTEDRFGVLEVTLEDQLTPMKKEAGNLALDFMMRLGAQTKEQEKNFETRLAEMEAKRAEAEAVHAEREARVESEEKSARNWLIGAVVLSSLFGAVAISALVVLLITRPLDRNVKIMSRLAGNDTDVEITDADRKDEIGEMAQAVQVFKDSLIEAERQAEERRAERASREERVRRIEALAKAFDEQVSGSLDTVGNATRQMKATSEQMSSIAAQTADQTRAVTQATESAAESVHTVASAADELSKSITEIAEQAATSNQVSEMAADQARKTDERVQRLNDAAMKIGEVIQLITDIAEQTNLLALNATIEAARAGEAGKGFAVVASEVKNLANQTAKATEEIAAQVSNIQEETGDTVRAIAKITESVDRMVEIASGISAAVEQQSAATREIARNTDEATAGTQQASANTTEVARAASETEQSAGAVLESVAALDSESDRLRRYVTDFLEQIRTA